MATTKTENKTLFIAIGLKDGLVYTGNDAQEAVDAAACDGYDKSELKILEVNYTVPKEITIIKTQKITLK